MVSWCVPCQQPLRWRKGTVNPHQGNIRPYTDWWACSSHWCNTHLFPTYIGTMSGIRTEEQKAFMLLLGNPPLSADEAVRKVLEES